MVTEIRGSTQGGLSQIIQKQTTAPGALAKDAPSTQGIEKITAQAQQTNVLSTQEIQQAVNNPALGKRLDVLASYLPLIYTAYDMMNSYWS